MINLIDKISLLSYLLEKGIIMKNELKFLKALADETRLNILIELAKEPKCVCDLVTIVDRAQPTVSIQLSKLEAYGIVNSKRKGKRVSYSIEDKRVTEVLKLLNLI